MASDSTLTLFIPDLFGFQSTLNHLSAEEKSSLPPFEIPLLEKWLSRGSYKKEENQEDSVFRALGLDELINKNKPYAALSLLAENISEIELNKKSYWLRADPVNLQPDRDTALLAGHEELNLTQDEADRLVAEINAHFIDEPWQLYTFTPHRWYLCLDKPADLKTTPLQKVLGEDINQFSPTGNDADYWFKVINELQMLIHGSHVNFERESRNKWTANSIWLWGGGFFPELNLNSSYNKILTNNLIYSGVGYHCSLDVIPLDNAFPEHIKEKNNFVVLDTLSEQVQNRDLYTFVQKLNALENDFFLHANTVLLNGTINKITLITDAGIFSVTKKHLKRWWKPIKPFVKHQYE